MSMQSYSDIVRDADGAIVPSPTIEVFEAGTLTRVDLFSDDAVSPTPLSNPFTGNTDGRFTFFAADGVVDIVVSGDGIDSYTIPSVLLDYTLDLPPATSAIRSINGQEEEDQTITIDDSGSDARIDSASGVHTIHLPTASGAVRGLLHPMHFTIFAQKVSSLNGIAGSALGIITGATGTDFNISGSGSNVVINLPTASSTNRGLLSAADFAVFSAKQAAFSGTTSQYVRGDGSLATLSTSVVTEGSNLYFTNARARSALSATSPIFLSGGGVISSQAASGSQHGYLLSTDWTIFNNKLGSVAPSITKDSEALKVDGTSTVRTADTTVDTTITETDLTSKTLGGAPSVGRNYRLRTGGTVRVGTNGTDTVRYRAYLGTVLIFDSGALDLTDATALVYEFELDAAVRTAGGSGVVQAIGRLIVSDSTLVVVLKSVNATSVVLTGTPVIKTTVQFSVSDATNQIVEKNAALQVQG